MSTLSRKQREREAREHLLLETARALVVSEGLLGLKMSRLARASDYAIGTLYQHFASKEDLLLALACQGLERKQALFEAVRTESLPTRERMLLLLRADLLAKQREPISFQLLQYVTTQVVWEAASDAARSRFLATSETIGETVGQLVAEAIEHGDLPETAGFGRDSCVARARAIALGPWALAIGVQTLMNARGLLEGLRLQAPEELLLLHAEHLLDGLDWAPVLDSGAADPARITQRLARQDQRIEPILDRLARPSSGAQRDAPESETG